MKLQELEYTRAVFQVSGKPVERETKKDVVRSPSRSGEGRLKSWAGLVACATYARVDKYIQERPSLFRCELLAKIDLRLDRCRVLLIC